MYIVSIRENVIQVIISIGQGIGNLFSWLFSLLPDDPINLNDSMFTLPTAVRNALGFVNWLIPLADVILLIGTWIVVILSIFVIRVLFKFFHFI